ncbi:hypothetical protein T484DRAFT_1935246 [Baffinella frigidus]|nr:hypothetical protein T484DRAFT_1935246 [Cryptophyta sp. CCMP2293]
MLGLPRGLTRFSPTGLTIILTAPVPGGLVSGEVRGRCDARVEQQQPGSGEGGGMRGGGERNGVG